MLWLAVPLALTLIAVTILMHHEVVHDVLGWAARSRAHARVKTLVPIVVFVATHTAAIAVFAAGYWVAARLGVGGFRAGSMTGPLDYVFFSAEAYTSVGYDTVFRPTGGVRLIAGMEAVVGLLMIAWSANATYLVLRANAPRRRRPGAGAPTAAERIVNE